jgi:putative phage-type endonuclease
MKTISTIQNTEEWHKVRNGKIGASDANIIMGVSKFMTPFELMKQKKEGPKKEEDNSSNYIQNKGHMIEEKLRNAAELIYDDEFPPLVVISDEYPFLMASLDGMGKYCGATWECKYVGQNDFDKVEGREMLSQYVPQVQQQIMLTGAPFCVFMVAADDKSESKNPDFPYKYAYIEVRPDFDYMKNQLLPKLNEFWDMMENGGEPDFSEKDVLNLDENEEMVELLGQYKETKTLLDKTTKEEKDLKSKIFKKIGKAKKAECNGVKITESVPKEKEVVNYEKFVTDSNFTVPDSYIDRKKGSAVKKITFPKSK